MLRGLILGAIRVYQAAISPLLPSTCRFVPSCSEYAREAIVRFGVLRGGMLAGRRLLRCRPFGGLGPDPVPDARPLPDTGGVPDARRVPDARALDARRAPDAGPSRARG